MAISRNASSLLALPDFPEFAQAVRYGVPGTRKQSTAEEPVAVRIRRRTQAVPASDLVTEPDVAPEAEGVRT